VFRTRRRMTPCPPAWTVTVFGTRFATTPTASQSSERWAQRHARVRPGAGYTAPRVAD
jgi:hypothetical protein